MKLSYMRVSDNIQKRQQTAFGGYNHRLSAGDGEIYDMENMTSDFFPLLSPRKKNGWAASKIWQAPWH